MMEKLSIQILCFIFLITKVWSDSCYSEADDTYKDCVADCCGPSVPGEQITCCHDTGMIIGICCLGLLFIAIIGLRIYCRLTNRNAWDTCNSYSISEREVLISRSAIQSPSTGYRNPS